MSTLFESSSFLSTKETVGRENVDNRSQATRWWGLLEVDGLRLRRWKVGCCGMGPLRLGGRGEAAKAAWASCAVIEAVLAKMAKTAGGDWSRLWDEEASEQVRTTGAMLGSSCPVRPVCRTSSPPLTTAMHQNLERQTPPIPLHWNWWNQAAGYFFIQPTTQFVSDLLYFYCKSFFTPFWRFCQKPANFGSQVICCFTECHGFTADRLTFLERLRATVWLLCFSGGVNS